MVDKPTLWFASILLRLHNKENMTTSAAPQVISPAEAQTPSTKQPIANSTNVTMGLSSNLKRTSHETITRDEVMQSYMYTLQHKYMVWCPQNRAIRSWKEIQLHVSASRFSTTECAYICVNVFNSSMCLYLYACQCFTMNLVEELYSMDLDIKIPGQCICFFAQQPVSISRYSKSLARNVECGG